MKILYLCSDPGIDPMGQSGGSIHIRAFVRALSELGHQVTVVCSSMSAGEGHVAADVRSSHLAPWNNWLAKTIQGANRLVGRTPRRHPDIVRILHNLTFYKTAAATAREIKPDLIYERYSLWGMGGVRLATRCSIPLVLEVNAPLVYEQQRYRRLSFPKLARSVELMIWRRAHLLITVSASLSRHLQDAGVAESRIRILPNAVDTRRFRPDVDGETVRRRFGLAERFIIGYVGTFKPWHGVDLLLQAFQDVHETDPKTQLLLIGDGPLRQLLAEQVRSRGLDGKVTFAGSVPHREMPNYLAAIDVAVAPYPALEEFYYSPIKLFEYMASGRAIVARDIGQVSQIIADGDTGLLFNSDDSSELVRCIRRMRDDAALRRTLGSKARAACSEFTWTHNASQVISWVGPLLEKEVV